MSNLYGKGLRGKATKLHAELVRSRGACQSCGGTSNLQCAHVIPRRYAATRVDPVNAYCLDAKCHMRFGEHADEWMAFIDRTIGRAEFDRLKALAELGVKANDAYWQHWIDRLTLMLKEAA